MGGVESTEMDSLMCGGCIEGDTLTEVTSCAKRGEPRVMAEISTVKNKGNRPTEHASDGGIQTPESRRPAQPGFLPPHQAM